jgi:hypothetical protein
MSAIDRPAARLRHPMGLPRGSVRALLMFMVLGLIVVLLFMPEEKKVSVPIYLYYLLFLMIGSYFATRGGGQVPGEPPPLYLPRGSVRLLIAVVIIGGVAYGVYDNPNFLERLRPSAEELAGQPYLPAVLLGAFLLGILVTRLANLVLAGPAGLPPWFQDVEAWVALLAVFGLGAELLIQLVINPNVQEGNRITLPPWQGILSGIIAFYFGARS